MTARERSRRILLASFPLLLVVWVIAGSYRTRYSIGSDTGLHGVALRAGSIEFFSEPWNDDRFRVDSWFEFLNLSSHFRHPWGMWDHTVTPAPGTRHSPGGPDQRWFLQMPVWVLWLPFAGCVLVCGRIVERRSGTGSAKELAETDGAGPAFSTRSPSAIPAPGDGDDGMSAPDASNTEDAPDGRQGSPADTPLVLSVAVLFMTSFMASTPGDLWSAPGDLWPCYGIAAVFSLWGLLEADTPVRRMAGLVLTTLCLGSAVINCLGQLSFRY